MEERGQSGGGWWVDERGSVEEVADWKRLVGGGGCWEEVVGGWRRLVGGGGLWEQGVFG